MSTDPTVPVTPAAPPRWKAVLPYLALPALLIGFGLGTVTPGCHTASPDRVVAPKADKLWLVVVYEESQADPAVADVLMDTAYWKGLEAQGHRYRFYDRDLPAAAPYVKAATTAGVGLPAILLYDAGNPKRPLLTAAKLPGTTAGVSQLESEVTGK